MFEDIDAKMLSCNCLAVRQAARYVTQIYDRHLASAGLRITQFGILARLKRRSMTINELAAEMMMDRTTLGRNIKPLERDKLISVKPSATDRRSKELHLTKAGERSLIGARDGWESAQRDFETAFGKARSAELRSLLRAVIASGSDPVGQQLQH